VDLKRHLLVHVKRNEISENVVDRLLVIVNVGKQKRGKQVARKGKKPITGSKKWCPVPFCSSIVLNIGRHLTNPNTHGVVKGSREYQRLVMQAREYTGVAEMDRELVPPPPAVVEIVPEADSGYKPTTTLSASALAEQTPGPVAALSSSRPSSSAVAGPVTGPSSSQPTSSAVIGPAARPSVAAGPALR